MLHMKHTFTKKIKKINTPQVSLIENLKHFNTRHPVTLEEADLNKRLQEN